MAKTKLIIVDMTLGLHGEGPEKFYDAKQLSTQAFQESLEKEFGPLSYMEVVPNGNQWRIFFHASDKNDEGQVRNPRILKTEIESVFDSGKFKTVLEDLLGEPIKRVTLDGLRVQRDSLQPAETER